MRQGIRKDYLKGSRRNGRAHSPFPFNRFLNSRLGRPWDDVYSEMSASFDHRSLVGYSFFRDLRWHVQTDCWVGADTGSIYSSHWGSRVENEFYVHPWTGLLSWAEPVDRTRPDPPKTSVDVEDVKRDRDGQLISGKAYEKIDGVWYYLENYDIEHAGFTNIRSCWRPQIIETDGETLYRVTWTEHVSIKRQLSKKELRKNGLYNGGAPYKGRCAICGFYGKCVHALKAEVR